MSKKTPGTSTDFREPFLAELLPRLASPNDARPTVRCWSESALRDELVDIGKKLHREGVVIPSSPALIAWLQEIKLAHLVPIHAPASKNPPRIFTFSMERATDGQQVHPIELLQAKVPSGIVCYFTALSFHALTTQIPSQHHIAKLEPPSPNSRVDSSTRSATSNKRSARVTASAAPPSPKRKFNPLGTLLFDYQNVPYYLTLRDPQLLSGVQTRYLDSRTMFRMTTREQTLIDTLHKPFSCGGPEVVFEAWRTAVEDLNERQLATTLEAIKHPALRRRVAAMLEQLEYKGGAELQALLKRFKARAAAPVSLLPGIEYHRLNSRWMVLVPG